MGEKSKLNRASFEIDDSKMPSAEEMKAFTKTEEIDKASSLKCDEIAKRFGLL